MKLTSRNSQRPGTESDLKANPDLSVLEAQGYFVYPVDKVTVLNADPWARKADLPLVHQELGPRGFDLVLSGPDTILVPGKWPHPPMGPVMRKGHHDTDGARGHFRGLVAVLEDGTIIVDKADGASKKDLMARFSQKDNPLRDVCGGGALLVENGRKVPEIALMREQLYGGSPGGIRSRPMNRGVHVIFGIRKGKAIAALCWAHTGMQIREDFLSMGFTSVVKFATGSAVYLNDQEYVMSGQNAVGMGIHRRR
jgi:hypothetical protein